MLKILVVVVIFCLPMMTYSQIPRDGSNQQEEANASQHDPPPNAPSTGVCPCSPNQTKPEEQSSRPESGGYHWGELSAPTNVPNWVLAAVGIGGIVVAVRTLRKLERQTKAAEDAANASLRQSEHMIASERAWMVARVEGEVIPDSDGKRLVRFSVRCVNVGKTPAYLIGMANHGVVLPRDQSLPDPPVPYIPNNVSEWPGEGISLQPEDFVLRHNWSTIARDLQKLIHGEDWLWVYGYINYRDAFGNKRETMYCFLWDCTHNIPGVSKETHFLVDGPASYIRAT
jgi:hypothetical protein